MIDALQKFWESTGIAIASADMTFLIKTLIMYVIIGALFYLAIVKKFEPLLLMPIAFGMLLANLPGANLIHLEYFFDDYYVAVQDIDGNGILALEEVTGTLAMNVQNFLAEVVQYADNIVVTENTMQLKMDYAILAY